MVTAQHGNKQLWKVTEIVIVLVKHIRHCCAARHETARHTQTTCHSHFKVACRWRFLKLTLKSIFLGRNNEERHTVPLCRSSNVCTVRMMRPNLLTELLVWKWRRENRISLLLLTNALFADNCLSWWTVVRKQTRQLKDKQVIADRQTDTRLTAFFPEQPG